MARRKEPNPWIEFRTKLGESWAERGFRQVRVDKGVGFLRELMETSQLVEYDLTLATKSDSVFSIGLAVWSHRLLKSGTRLGHRLDIHDGHWRDNLINLMPLDSAQMWWTVRLATLEDDISFHAGLIRDTILPILNSLAGDSDLVRAWRSGGDLAGLTPLGDRATNAVALAYAVHGRDEALAVARDMSAIAEKAGRERPVMKARLRQIIESLPVDAEFFEANPEREMN